MKGLTGAFLCAICIISMGYNGFLPGRPHESIVRDGHEQATVHAEQNAITDCFVEGLVVMVLLRM